MDQPLQKTSAENASTWLKRLLVPGSIVVTYLISFTITAIAFAVVPTILYFIGMIVAIIGWGDMGGPCNIVLVPLLSIVMGIFLSAVIQLITFPIHMLSRRHPYFLALAPAVLCVAAGLLTYIGGLDSLENFLVTLAVSLYLLGGIAITWTIVGGSLLGEKVVAATWRFFQRVFPFS